MRITDLSQFAPQGNGVYGYQRPGNTNPLLNAPQQEAAGGVLYFGNGVSKDDFGALLRIVGDFHKIGEQYDYAVFNDYSGSTPGILSQMRIVSKFGLRYLFDAITDEGYKNFQNYPHNMLDVCWLFMEDERKRWGTSFGDLRIAGKLGVDRHFAQEELAFGFLVENSYFGVYRIWSRPWLVTK